MPAMTEPLIVLEDGSGRIVGSGGARAADEMSGFALRLWAASLLHR
jgi:hypothetical protein